MKPDQNIQQSHDIISFPLSKTKLFLGILGSLVFVVLGIYFLINSASFFEGETVWWKSPIFLKIIGLISILFFGSTGIYGFKKLSDPNMGVKIDQNGITDHSNASSIGFISWSDIVKIRIQEVVSTKFILVEVANPEDYIQKASSKFQAKLMRSNFKLYKTPISITANTLACSFDELEKAIEEGYSKYG